MTINRVPTRQWIQMFETLHVLVQKCNLQLVESTGINLQPNLTKDFEHNSISIAIQTFHFSL